MSALPWPLRFKRQYAAPLDQDGEFATTAARNAYLSNPLCYPGQMVYDQEAEKTLWVKADLSGYDTYPSQAALDALAAQLADFPSGSELTDLRNRLTAYVGRFASQVALDQFVLNNSVSLLTGYFAVLVDLKSFVIYDADTDTWAQISGGGGGSGPSVDEIHLPFGELDTTISAPILMVGVRTNFNVTHPSEITSYVYKARLETQTGFTDLADETALQAWVNGNVPNATTQWELIVSVTMSSAEELTAILSFQ